MFLVPVQILPLSDNCPQNHVTPCAEFPNPLCHHKTNGLPTFDQVLSLNVLRQRGNENFPPHGEWVRVPTTLLPQGPSSLSDTCPGFVNSHLSVRVTPAPYLTYTTTPTSLHPAPVLIRGVSSLLGVLPTLIPDWVVRLPSLRVRFPPVGRTRGWGRMYT